MCTFRCFEVVWRECSSVRALTCEVSGRGGGRAAAGRLEHPRRVLFGCPPPPHRRAPCGRPHIRSAGGVHALAVETRGVGASSVLGRRGAKTLLPRQTPRVQQARQDTEQCSLYIQRPAALGDRWAGMPSTASDAAAAAGLALVAEAEPDACAPPDGSGARGPLVVTLCGHVCDYERLERAWRAAGGPFAACPECGERVSRAGVVELHSASSPAAGPRAGLAAQGRSNACTPRARPVDTCEAEGSPSGSSLGGSPVFGVVDKAELRRRRRAEASGAKAAKDAAEHAAEVPAALLRTGQLQLGVLAELLSEAHELGLSSSSGAEGTTSCGSLLFALWLALCARALADAGLITGVRGAATKRASSEAPWQTVAGVALLGLGIICLIAVSWS